MATLLDGLPILLLVSLTSIGALWLGVKQLALPMDRLPAAIGTLLEALGLIILFLLVNTVVGVAIPLAIRTFTGTFLSVYVVGDERLLILASIQGLAFQQWRSSAGSRCERAPRP